jgi:hypothetical protein
VKTLESKEAKAQRNATLAHNSVFAAAHRQMPDDDCKIDIRHFLFLDRTVNCADEERSARRADDSECSRAREIRGRRTGSQRGSFVTGGDLHSAIHNLQSAIETGA